MSFTVEKEWTTKAGYLAVVIHGDRHRCGYVAVTPDHKLYGVEYHDNCEALSFPADESIGKRGILSVLCSQEGDTRPDLVFDVHGSLTYSGGNDEYPIPGNNLWWFGFDCCHCDDASSPEYYQQAKNKYPNSPFMWQSHGTYRTLEYCIDECESLASQLTSRVRREFAA